MHIGKLTRSDPNIVNPEAPGLFSDGNPVDLEAVQQLGDAAKGKNRVRLFAPCMLKRNVDFVFSRQALDAPFQPICICPIRDPDIIMDHDQVFEILSRHIHDHLYAAWGK